jgi:hypothetical protein
MIRTCPRCGSEVIVGKKITGAWLILDATPDQQGFFILEGEGRYPIGRMLPPSIMAGYAERYTTHINTCQAKLFAGGRDEARSPKTPPRI